MMCELVVGLTSIRFDMPAYAQLDLPLRTGRLNSGNYLFLVIRYPDVSKTVL